VLVFIYPFKVIYFIHYVDHTDGIQICIQPALDLTKIVFVADTNHNFII
jgi:hypothetical protein